MRLKNPFFKYHDLIKKFNALLKLRIFYSSFDIKNFLYTQLLVPPIVPSSCTQGWLRRLLFVYLMKHERDKIRGLFIV